MVSGVRMQNRKEHQMTDQTALTPGVDLESGVVQSFAGSVRGSVLRCGDADYDSARAIFNGMIDRRPALIVRCAGIADVIAAVKLARKHNLEVAVRGGGHNVAGNCICNDGMMIDLSPM